MFNARIHHTSGKLRTRLLVGVAAAVSLFAATGAQAQNCTFVPNPNITNLGNIGAAAASVSSMIASTLASAETAFLLQSTSFIGSPANPAPDQQGGGVWTRVVGGEVTTKSTTGSIVSAQGPLVPLTQSPVNCSQSVHETFVGAQLGADIARLNVNGWNFHFGATAGYLETRNNLREGAFFDPTSGAGGGPFESKTQIPFVGTYAAATYGGFFVDGLLRFEAYQTALNSPSVSLFNQEIDARGVSFSASTGYNWRAPDSNWFVEPSAGIIISDLKVDPFNFATGGLISAAGGFSGTLRLNDIKSDVGRVGLRVGTIVDSGNIVWQPFGAVSVWHEFGPNITSNYMSCNANNGTPGCAFLGGILAFNNTVSAVSSTSTVGTYGQFSLGVSAQVKGTGWLGFARVDYRNGSNLQGLSGTGGIRYQFTPEEIVRPKMPVKAPVYKAPIIEAVNWTGFYIGGFGSGDLGKADWGFVGGEANPHVGGYDLGGNIGYNWQSGRWVFGVEGALEKTNLKGGIGCAPLVDNFSGNPSPMFQMTCNASANWIAEATARIGFTWDRALFYVKGGGAWTNEQFSATCNLSPAEQVAAGGGVPNQQCANPAGVASSGFTASTNRAGFLIGWGTEFALTRNWSAKAETSYLNFGDKNVIASDGSLLNVGMQIWETKIGVNYRFDVGPVVARY